MTSRPLPQCPVCRHWRSPLVRTDPNAREPEPTQVCLPFPLERGGIPDDIWWNRVDHRHPYPGDGGVTWLADGDAKFPEWAMES